jgi:protein-S-isoprenylcysteine O-methyltransferase Ste14
VEAQAWWWADREVAVAYVLESQLASSTLGVTAAAFAVGELVLTLRFRRGGAAVDMPAEIFVRGLLLTGALSLPLGRAVVPHAVIGGGSAVFSVGVVVAWLGLGLRWWSFVVLGRYFTVVLKATEDQPIVDRGPYRVLRHPSYAGLLIAVTGFAVMWGNWLSIIAAASLVAIGLVYRITVEERAMTAALGDRYRDFAAGRARLLPYVW